MVTVIGRRAAVSVVFICIAIGIGAGAGIGMARNGQRATRMNEWESDAVGPAASELASESEFYLRLEPSRISRTAAGETIELRARLGSIRASSVRTIMSMQVEDDTGTVVRSPTLSQAHDLTPATEIAHATSVAPLTNGWYRLRAHAVFVDPATPGEALGSETDSLYIEVSNGEVYVVDMTDWFAASNANLSNANLGRL